MTQAHIDGRNMTTRAAAHDEIARALALPEYYGRNLDALFDVLSDFVGAVTLSGTDSLLAGLGEYGLKLIAVFFDAARANPEFAFQIVEA